MKNEYRNNEWQVFFAIIILLSTILMLQPTPAVATAVVTTLPATEITSMTAVLIGSISGLGTDGWAQWWIEGDGWTMADPPWVFADCNIKFGIGKHSGAGTSCRYRVAAVVSPYGQITYGQWLTFTYLPLTGNLTVATGQNIPETTSTGLVVNTYLDTATTTSADLEGSLSDGSGYGHFEYGNTTSYGFSTAPQSLPSRGWFQGKVTGLTPGTNYHYRAVVVGSSTVFGNDKTFKTKEENPTPAVHTLGAINVVSTMATICGSFENVCTECHPYSYFQYGTTTAYGLTTDKMTRLSDRCLVSGLLPNTTYHFRVVVNTDSGPLYGEDRIFTTPATAPTPTPAPVPTPSPDSTPPPTPTPTPTPTPVPTPSPDSTPTPTPTYPSTSDHPPFPYLPPAQPPISQQKLIGLDTINSIDDNAANNYFHLTRYTANQSGTISILRVLCVGAGNIKVAIYADKNGEPCSLLTAVNSSTPVYAGWNSIPISSTSITAGNNYWLAMCTDSIIMGTESTTNSVRRFKPVNYSAFVFPGQTGTGFTVDTSYYDLISGWGQVLTPTPATMPTPTPAVTPSLTPMPIPSPTPSPTLSEGTPIWVFVVILIGLISIVLLTVLIFRRDRY